MSTPNNASTIVHILSHLDANPGKFLTRNAQDEYLKTLTSTYSCFYKSSTFGCTLHNETSLRKALTSIMASYIRPGVDMRPGTRPVDELFERGSEMLDEQYFKGLKETAKGQVFERRAVESEDSCSDEEHEEDLAMRRWTEPSSGSDEDWEPGSKRTRTARTRKNQARRKDGSVRSPSALKKTARKDLRYGNLSDRSEPSLGRKGSAPTVQRRPSTIDASEDSGGDDADNESCNKRARVWRKPVQGSPPAEAMLPELSMHDGLRTVPPVSTRSEAHKTEVLGVATTMPPDLETQISELNDLIRSSAERYVAGHPSTHANLISRPPPELEALYVQAFNMSDWRSIAVQLQSRGGLSAVELLRSLVSAFLFTRIFTKAGDLPWLAPEVVVMFKCIMRRLPALNAPQDESNVACLFEDEQLKTAILRPQARTLASECLLVFNDHLSTLSGSRRSCEVGARLREDLELAFEKALEIQSRLSFSMKTHEWTWSAIGPSSDFESMPTSGVEDRSGRVALTLFPGIVWEGETTGGLVRAVVALSSKSGNV